MAKAETRLIEALRATAARLTEGAVYRWTHQGACNCGHLAQTLTRRSREELHRIAVEKAGDWGEHAVDYCPTSGLPLDAVLTEMLDAGLELSDVGHLERLSDPAVVRRFPLGERSLDARKREDVVRYLLAWAALLDERRLDALPPPPPPVPLDQVRAARIEAELAMAEDDARAVRARLAS
jgi:hypothetical protein